MVLLTAVSGIICRLGFKATFTTKRLL